MFFPPIWICLYIKVIDSYLFSLRREWQLCVDFKYDTVCVCVLFFFCRPHIDFYVSYIFTGWYEDNWYEVNLENENISCTREQMKIAAEGHLTTEALMWNQNSQKTISGMSSEDFRYVKSKNYLKKIFFFQFFFQHQRKIVLKLYVNYVHT